MIIGLVGFAGSGKGTAGQILQDNGFIPLSFAGCVKDVVATMFNWPRHLLEGDTDVSRLFRETPDEFWSSKFGRPFTPREAMQKIGTECGRELFHNDFWILSLEKIIEKNKDYVLTDVRFPNEMYWIKRQKGFIFQIQRGVNPNWYNELSSVAKKTTGPDGLNVDQMRKFMQVYNVHESEWAWVGNKNIDGLVLNNKTTADLNYELIKTLTKKTDPSKIESKIYYGHNGD